MRGGLEGALACVTGAFGLVGSRVCERLLSRGYRVRALSRRPRAAQEGIEWRQGDILNDADVRAFLRGARIVFHCAAELKDRARMADVNVRGTERILKAAEASGVEYLCHLSSVGVIGRIDADTADESTPCAPQDDYERSKWAAEQSVMRGVGGCRVVVLRPTNVVDVERPGLIGVPLRRSLVDLGRVLIQGGECAHLVPAEDVASAALHLLFHPAATPQRYIVSLDDDPLNTLAGVWAMCDAAREGNSFEDIKPVPHMPSWVPVLLRELARGRSNRGDLRYSSAKLRGTGFEFKTGLRGLLRRIVSARGSA